MHKSKFHMPLIFTVAFSLRYFDGMATLVKLKKLVYIFMLSTVFIAMLLQIKRQFYKKNIENNK